MISILLATYNGERYICESIESILNQTYTEFELLIGFNGTTDNSKKLVGKYNDPRIRIFDYEKDKGKSKTLNKLLVESKYDWIAIQDDDDVWLNTKLEKQVRFINNFDVIGSFIDYINENGEITGCPNLATKSDDIKLLSISGNNQIANTSAIFKKNDAVNIGGWRSDLDGIEDFDFWLRLIRLNKEFINLNEKLVLHRLHSNSNFNTKEYNLKKII